MGWSEDVLGVGGTRMCRVPCGTAGAGGGGVLEAMEREGREGPAEPAGGGASVQDTEDCDASAFTLGLGFSPFCVWC